MGNLASAQMVQPAKDSTELYVKIEQYSKQSSFKGFVYRLLFKPIPKKTGSKKKKRKVVKQKPYSRFEGKIIRHITIVTLDPFGFSIGDTIEANLNKISKIGNAMHKKTENITIRNLLLVHQNQAYDSLLVRESERLVRSQSYIRDVSFYTSLTSRNSDSVDIFIRELDNWSLIPRIVGSPKHIIVTVTDKNFLGTGHEFRNTYSQYPFTGENTFNTNYFIPNIRNTFITSTLHYGTDEYRNFNKTFAVDRPFFSPFAHWAAGVDFTQQFHQDSVPFPDSVYFPRKYKFNSQDFWAGYAMPIFKGNTEKNRTTNLITTIRFLRVRFLEQPLEIVDPQHNYSDENFYLAGVGISSRRYHKDSYIFKYGVTEDVPVGRVYGITGGYQTKNNIGRLYLGARFSAGNYFDYGYISTNLEYGTFFRASQTQQGIINGSVNYFTKLETIGKWKFRQFIKPQLTIGLNRFSYDSLTINNGYGIDGFNSKILSGISRILLTFQTQSYAPWNFIGFRFGPYITYSMGMLGNRKTGFRNSNIYSQIGFGILIKNENLILNTFQISISFYPIIPGIGSDIFKMNAFKTSDFGFRDFELGKPGATVFQ
jgi:hypothetical protein